MNSKTLDLKVLSIDYLYVIQLALSEYAKKHPTVKVIKIVDFIVNELEKEIDFRMRTAEHIE